MLNKVDFPLTTSQISEFVLTEGYTDYLKLQMALSDMVESNLLIIESTHNRTLYYLTNEGSATIALFEDNISPAIQSDIDHYLKHRYFDLKEESGIKSSYHQKANGEYLVHCQIIENGASLIDLKLTIPTKKEATALASNWNRKGQQLYTSLLMELL